MKRILALLMALLVAFALVSCGNKAKEEPKEEGNGESASSQNGEKKVLKIAMECAYAPYNWSQPTDANGALPISGSSEYAYGYDVMMAKLLAEKLDYEIEIVRLSWDAIIPAIQSGAVDIAICGQSITTKRLEMVDFTEPYYYATIATLVPKDGKYANATSVADLKGATCTSQLNTIWETVCLPQIPDANQLSGQDDAPTMTAALITGGIDLVVTDRPTALAAVAANPSLKMLEFEVDKDFEVSEEDVNIGISLRKGNNEIRDALNSVLSKMTKDDFDKMMDEAIAVQPLSQ